MLDRESVRKCFLEYTEQYDLQNLMVRHKLDHSLRVADIAEEIAISLHLSAEDAEFAWLLGLLHDIGRFEQVKCYDTFVDSISVDHAELGADILFMDGFMKRLPIEELPETRLALMDTAIRVHNKLTVPEKLDEESRMFCNLLRDADKVDIFRLISELSFDERIGSGKNLFVEEQEASPEVMECVYQHTCVPRESRRSRFDVRISNCCMAFEIVFDSARDRVIRDGYLLALVKEVNPDENSIWCKKMAEQIRIVQMEIEKSWNRSLNG